MRKLIAFTLVALFGGAFAASAADKKPTLNIGDKAPPLKVTKWVQGEEVKEFATGKVYVVEFWATWCGPCISAMPHIQELQTEFKKDLVVIGLTSKDPNNGQEKVEKFVEKNKAKFTYRFAFSEDDATYKAYMDAAQQNGIPCSFVVDKTGKIAYIGHPMQLDEVLPKVVDGTWKGQADVDALAAADKELEAIMESADKKPEEALTALAAFEKKNPAKAKQDMFNVQKMVLQMQGKKFDDAKATGEAMLAKSLAKKTAMPGAYTGMILADKKLNPDKKNLDLAAKAIDTALQFEPKDIGLFLAALDLQLTLGNKDKAAEYGKKAVESAEEDAVKKQVEKIVEMKLKAEK